ncbi:GbpC/Spa domain-containing protein [Lactobacillus sp. 3B(2020)]|uniref:GbpC/Spa domain-containing protein n=1 Tax=Lactobacillus sp. 3B(2020) TaxID=2695882 RepID=UPI0015DDB113|nr:GbpC/Spa domain-containing protein [Lactobacillus sp. 3B(2020)]QLL71054.1 YSIRK-type signal peptide-containing protein [Lactobacillus sp. 3B(2020)]
MVGKNNTLLRDTKNGEKIIHYSIRKFSVGAVSIALGTLVLTGSPVHAATSNASSNIDNTGQSSIKNQKESQNNVSDASNNSSELVDMKTSEVTTSNDKETQTTTITTGTLNPDTKIATDSRQSTSLNSAVRNANEAGVKTKQTETKNYSNVSAAKKDYAEQIKNIDKVTTDYKKAQGDYKKAQEKYSKDTKTYQVAKEKYEAALAEYNKQQQAYKDYQDKVAKDKSDYESNTNLTNVKQSISTKDGIETTTTSADVKPSSDLNNAINNAKGAGITITKTDTQETNSVEEANNSYSKQAEIINGVVAQYNKSVEEYNAKLAEYNKQLESYNTSVKTYQVAKEKYEAALAEYNKQQQAYKDYQDKVAKDKSDYESNTNLTNVKQSISTKDGIETTTTSADVKPSSDLNNAINNAKGAGITITKTDTQETNSVEEANNSYSKQAETINGVVAQYNKSVEEYNAKLAEYNKQLESYNTSVKTYQVAKEKYEAALAEYNKQQQAYKDYQDKVAKDKSDYESNTNLTNVKQSISTKDGIETTTTSADVKPSSDLNNAINNAKGAGITITKTDTQEATNYDDASQKYASMTDKINKAIKDYADAIDMYNAQVAVYNEEKAKYDEQKKAYDEYQKEVSEGRGAGAVVAAQGLVFEQQTNATMTIEGADTYMTREVSNKLNSQDVVSRFNKAEIDNMTDADGNKTAYQSTNPNKESENVWIVLKKGQVVTVTYHNLEGVKYDGNPVDHVVYTYELESSSDGSDEAMAQIMHDPTQTIWVGSNSKDPNEHLKVKMTIGFYDANNQKIDTSNGHAILSLSSLNHYTTVPYITEDGKHESINMNHLERVNIGNNEFVPIPGSSVTLNENDWVYSVNSNQRISEGAKFDADDVYTFVNKKTGAKFYTKDSNITYNNYIKANGGASDWVLASKTTGWDDLPAATEDGKWPGNKYYGAGAMKLVGDYIEIDVSGNTPAFNTSYWFTLNSLLAIPENPGEEPKVPEKPTANVEYNEFTVSTSESITPPTAPKPKFDTPKPGEKPKKPDNPSTPSVEWNGYTVSTSESVTPPTAPKPKFDTPKPGEKPKKPDNPSTPSVEWNGYTVSTSESVTPPTAPKPKFDTPKPGEKPEEPNTPEVDWHLATVTMSNVVRTPKEKETPNKPHKVVKKRVPSHKMPTKMTKSEVLPQTGSKDNSLLRVLGSIVLALAGLFGLTIKRKEKDYN